MNYFYVADYLLNCGTTPFEELNRFRTDGAHEEITD